MKDATKLNNDALNLKQRRRMDCRVLLVTPFIMLSYFAHSSSNWGNLDSIKFEMSAPEKGIAIQIPIPVDIDSYLTRDLKILSSEKNGTLWIGNSKGIYKWDIARKELTTIDNSFAVKALTKSDSMLWLVIRSQGLSELVGVSMASLQVVVRQPLSQNDFSLLDHIRLSVFETQTHVSIRVSKEERSSIFANRPYSFVYSKNSMIVSDLTYAVLDVFEFEGQTIFAIERHFSQDSSDPTNASHRIVEICKMNDALSFETKHCIKTNLLSSLYNKDTSILGSTKNSISRDDQNLWMVSQSLYQESAEISVIDPANLEIIRAIPLKKPELVETFPFRSSSPQYDNIEFIHVMSKVVFLRTKERIVLIDKATGSVSYISPSCSNMFSQVDGQNVWFWPCNDFNVAGLVRFEDPMPEFYEFGVQGFAPITSKVSGWELLLHNMRRILQFDDPSMYRVDMRNKSLRKMGWQGDGDTFAVNVGEYLYLYNSKNLYTWEFDSNIELKINQSLNTLQREFVRVLSLFIDRVVLLDGTYSLDLFYNRHLNSISGPKILEIGEDHFWFAFLEDDKKPSTYIPWSKSLFHEITLGNNLFWRNTTLTFRINDRYGNRVKIIKNVTIFSTLFASITGFYLFLGVVMLAMVLLAPYLPMANNFVMNPFLRKWGSMMSIPLILSLVPPLRRHLLLRYRKNLKASLANEANSYIEPNDKTTSQNIFAELPTQESVLLIYGESGIGKTALLHHLAFILAQNPKNFGFKTELPVLIHLKEYTGIEPEKVLSSELRGRGQFSDPELEHEMLRQGNIVFLVDGLNEVPLETQARWRGFARSNTTNHKFIFTSQSVSSEFDDVKYVKLGRLSEKVVIEILIYHNVCESKEIELLPKQTLELAKNPQILFTLIRTIKNSSDYPETEIELYNVVINDLDNKGLSGAIGELREIALERAYRGRSDVFVQRELSGKLDFLREKILIRSNDNIYFASDRFAAYLASQLISQKPQHLNLIEGLKANEQWELVLDFLANIVEERVANDVIRMIIADNTIGALSLAESFAAKIINANPRLFSDNWYSNWSLRFGTIRREYYGSSED